LTGASQLPRDLAEREREVWWMMMALGLAADVSLSTPLDAPLATNQDWEALPEPADEAALRLDFALASWIFAAAPGGIVSVGFAGEEIDARRLARWAATPLTRSLVTAVREDLRRPVDVHDLALFLDDLITTGRLHDVTVPAGRARSEGLLVHPREVYQNQDWAYGTRPLATAASLAMPHTDPAEDGTPLGVGWTARFANPRTVAERLDALTGERPEAGLAERVASLGAQIEAQGGLFWVTSTVRDPRRGLLLWGSFLLSQARSAAQVEASVSRLEAAAERWGVSVDIVWRHPEGWQATVRAATEMAEAYDVVYATERGARSSRHYGGLSVDMVAIGLPASLTLVGSDGVAATFDLSDPSHTRDLSLEVDVVRWVERHFALRKLDSDYPHWTDTR